MKQETQSWKWFFQEPPGGEQVPDHLGPGLQASQLLTPGIPTPEFGCFNFLGLPPGNLALDLVPT